MGIQVKVDVRGIPEVQQVLDKLAAKMKSRTQLHQRWAILAFNWVQRNFASEGGNVGGWKPLSPNTLAARRGGSGRILQDTGVLKGSFIPRWTASQASVGSPMKYAEYHERGTQPYIIRPKRPGGFLRFQVATSTGVKTKVLKSGRSIDLKTAQGAYIFTKEVHHPGLPIRRMLPRANEPDLIEQLIKSANNYLRQQSEGG